MAARRAPDIAEGVEAIRVEKLAYDLKVTKGSFHWQLAARAELLEALLTEWERELSRIAARFGL